MHNEAIFKCAISYECSCWGGRAKTARIDLRELLVFFSFFKIFPSFFVVFVDFPLVPHILVTRLCYPIPLFPSFACHFISSLHPNFPPSFPFASGLSASFHKPQLAISPCPDLRKLVPLQVVFPIFWYSIPSYRTRYWYFTIRQFWMRNNVGKGLLAKFTKQILG